MNAGKSTSLLQSSHNYEERDLNVLLFTPEVDAKIHDSFIHSRIGLKKPAYVFNEKFDFIDYVYKENKKRVSCILVDEAQFLTSEQVKQLCRICDEKNIPIMCYGIRTDFRGELFSGSLALLSLADNIIELKTICEYPSCSRKATMIARYAKDGEIVLEGNQIDIGADKYKVYCRKHYRELTKII